MNSKPTIAAIFAAIFMIALGAAQAANAEPPADACSMLPASQIEQALVHSFGAPDVGKWPPAFGKQPWGTKCEYNSKDSPEMDVTFIVYVDASSAEAKQTFDKLSMWFPPKSKPAIGDSAYLDGSHAIHVLKGKVRYYISISPANETQAKDLAAAVASRI